MPVRVTENVTIIDREIMDPIIMNRMRSIQRAVENALERHQARTENRSLRSMSRMSEEGGSGIDPRRDLNKECGYPETDGIRLQDYRDQYDRNPIAAKVVDILPKHCWKDQPFVYEDEDPNVETPFEKSFMEVCNSLNGDSKFEGNVGNQLWETMMRADMLSGKGHYGVILLGLGGKDGQDLKKPLELKEGPRSRELIYMKAFPEMMAPIKTFNDDRSSPRYRLPETYDVNFEDYNCFRVTMDTSVRPVTVSEEVHWTRIIHVAEGDDVYAVPRMRPVFNRLLDLDKLYGGSAEMYWQGAFPGIHWGTHPQLGGDVTIDYDTFKKELENFFNGLQRYTATVGMTPTSLSPQVVDPSAQIDAHIQAICIHLDCPKRIFMGSERGELSSEQDSGSWENVLAGRRNRYITPKIIVPVVDRLRLLKVLDPPKKSFHVEWPQKEQMTESEKAERASKITQAIVQYIAGDGYMVMPLQFFLTNVIGLTDEEAKSIIEELSEPDYAPIIKPEPEEPPTGPDGEFPPGDDKDEEPEEADEDEPATDEDKDEEDEEGGE